MSLLDIYKAKQLGINTDPFFGALLGKAMGDTGEWITESVPYSKRITANGANVGSKCKDTIVGGSIVWNQIVPTAQKSGARTPSGTTTYDIAFVAGLSALVSGIYFIQAEFTYNGDRTNLRPYMQVESNYVRGGSAKFFNKDGIGHKMIYGGFVRAGGTSHDISVALTSNSVINASDVWSFDNLIAINITKAFGSAIAEEWVNASDVYAINDYFRSLFPENSYSMSSAVLQHVNASAHITRDADSNVIGNYALDSSLVLRGIPKLDDNKSLYFDGDVYQSNGTVTRNIGVRAFQSGDTTDGSTMITDGINTVYKLDTPTTESADPYTNPQKIAKNGTEEYVDYSVLQGVRDVSIPVGHITEYKVRSE